MTQAIFWTDERPEVAQGDIIYGGAAGGPREWVTLAKNTTATRYLSNTGASNNPAWAQVDASNGITGTLPVASGGTGIATLAANRIPYGNGTSPFQSAANFTFDGTTFTTPGQIAFPATQNPSANANTLDDYEEGTWTPSIGGTTSESGQVYSSQLGNYTKIGKFVYVSYYIILSTLGTITGNLVIKNLPFTVGAGNGNYSNGTMYWEAWTTAMYFVLGNAEPGTTQIRVFGISAASTTLNTPVTQGDLTNTSIFIGNLIHQASA